MKKKDIGVGKITQLSDIAVIAPIIDDSGTKLKYYDTENKIFWQISFDGSFKKKISNEDFIDLSFILWAPSKKKAIIKMNREYYSYSHEEGTKQLKSGVGYLNWANIGDKIIYTFLDKKTNEVSLNIANADGSNWKKIIDLSNKNIAISAVPQSSLVSYWIKPSFHSANSQLKAVNISGGEVKIITKNERVGADYLWSPNGNKVLISYSVGGGASMLLEVEDVDNNKIKNLNIPAFISKCIWAKNSRDIYCALPLGIPNESVLPDDYQQRKFFSKDTFWKIDTVTGKRDRLVELENMNSEYDATNLILSPNEDILFFTDRKTGKLYRITL